MFIAKALAGALACAMMILAAADVFAAPRDDAVSEKGKEQTILDRKVPIPGWSPPLENNGCKLHKDPQDLASDARAKIPLWTLIGDLVGRYAVRVVVDQKREGDDFRSVIAALDPEVRTLATLYALEYGLGRDGLHTFFFLAGGSIAPDVRLALKDAGLTRELEIFTKAMDVFGPTYPISTAKRELLFGYQTGPELNAFDLRLMAVTQTFPKARALRASIVQYVETHQSLWERVEARRVTLSDQARLRVLYDGLIQRLPADASPQSLAIFTKEERTILMLGLFADEFENGGVHQYFFNSSGDFAPDVLEALLEAKLDRQAAILKRGMDMFAAPYPRDREKRHASYIGMKDDEGFEIGLSALTDDFYAIDGGAEVSHIGGSTQIIGGPDLREGMARYVILHDMLPC